MENRLQKEFNEYKESIDKLLCHNDARITTVEKAIPIFNKTEANPEHKFNDSQQVITETLFRLQMKVSKLEVGCLKN